MNTRRRISILFFALAAATLIYWASMGASIFSSTERLVQVQKKDDLFGTVVTTDEWQKHFTLGLDYAGPVAGVLIVAGAWLLFGGRKRSDALTA